MIGGRAGQRAVHRASRGTRHGTRWWGWEGRTAGLHPGIAAGASSPRCGGELGPAPGIARWPSGHRTAGRQRREAPTLAAGAVAARRYATLQIPSNILLRRFGGPGWLSAIIAAWGAIAVSFAFMRTQGQVGAWGEPRQGGQAAAQRRGALSSRPGARAEEGSDGIPQRAFALLSISRPWRCDFVRYSSSC